MDITRLHYMANQIAKNLAPLGEAEAVEGTTQHIRDFWDPRMKTAILTGADDALSPIARQAVQALRG